MTETQGTIVHWAHATFGAPTQLATVYERCADEFIELEEEVYGNRDKDKIANECADVFIVLCQVAEFVGADLQEAINRKMEKNRNRKWAITGEGVGQHI